ncbi:MAG: DUF1552 domain-containing protein [Planctomycetaceae bacterium]
MNDLSATCSKRLPRRTLLRGAGTAIALPLLDAMLPADGPSSAMAASRSARKVRMAFLYTPNGVHMPDWTPATEGSGYQMPWILEPLAGLREKFSILTGLAHKKANANGDGPGDHARAMTTFLTGVQARKTSGADIHAGTSVDQVAASKAGGRTRFASLEIGAEGGGRSGSCDSGYSCAYSSTISWRSETQPVPKETDPRLIFERLFEDGRASETVEARERRLSQTKSILDFALDDARRLEKSLGSGDRRKLDEYLSSIREIETRIGRAGRVVDDRGMMQKPDGTPASYEDHLRLLADLLVLAFKTDSTRIATFVFANEGSNRSYADIDVPEGHHDLSHHGNDPLKHEKIRRINRFHIEQFAYFLEGLEKSREGDRSLLDDSLIVVGSCIGDGNRHEHEDLPVILAGGGAGSLRLGKHVVYPSKTPMSNLHLELLERFGTPVETLGDSTGRLEGI